MSTRRKIYIVPLFLAILAVMLAAVGWWVLDAGETPISYRTAKITRGSISEVVTSNGTLNPLQLVNVGTQVSGQVSKVYAHVNDQVTKGELLAEIDPALLITQIKQDTSALETSRAAYEQATRDLNRTKMLLEKDYVAKVDLEHAEQTYLSAKNSLESAKMVVERDQVNLGYAKITAPIDGIIISQDVTLGETVQASFQTPNMFKIAGDLTKMKIDVSLAESDIGKVKVDMPVTFTVDAFPDRQFSGTVQSVDLNPNMQQGVVTYTVVVTVANPDKVLLPGMTAYVNIVLFEKKNVLRVPAAALRFTPPVEQVNGLRRLLAGGMRRPVPASPPSPQDDKIQTIYLLRDDHPIPVSVKTDARDGSNVEISGEGIAEGDTVVTGIIPNREN